MVQPFNSNLNVLVVEDDPNDVLLLKMGFQRSNRSSALRIVDDGEQAVKYLCGQPPFEDRTRYPFPNMILTDLKMPRMDGFELLSWLRDHPEYAVIPTIVMSSSGHPKDVRRAYQLGANCFFVKPSNLDELLVLIRVTFQFWSQCERPGDSS